MIIIVEKGNKVLQAEVVVIVEVEVKAKVILIQMIEVIGVNQIKDKKDQKKEEINQVKEKEDPEIVEANQIESL